MNWYARLLANHPGLVITVVGTVASVLIILSFVLRPVPKLEDPQVGFETRNTELSGRKIAWDHLLKETSSAGLLVLNPRKEIAGFKNKYFGRSYISKRSLERNNDFEDDLAEESKHKRNLLSKIGYSVAKSINFCGSLVSDYGHVVMRSRNEPNMWSVEKVLSTCWIEKRFIRGDPLFPNICTTTHYSTCCPSWSLGNYVALLNNKTSCMQIVSGDLKIVLDLLQGCAKYYHNDKLKPDCSTVPCRDVPHRCTQYDAVYNILHYLVDSYFLSPKMKNYKKLMYTTIFLPIPKSSVSIDLFLSIEDKHMTDLSTEVVAVDFGIKYALFNHYLLHDAVFLAVGVLAISICICIYTGSMFITIMTLCGILLSLGVAYFMYSVIFNVQFFPFMNVMTLVICIGTGADGAFIYCKSWHAAKLRKNNGTLAKLVSDTLKHASGSMFVTSVTTAAAFYANLLSNISAIKCFSLYAGTAVLSNFLLMLTWIPAAVIVSEKRCLKSDCQSCVIHSVSEQVNSISPLCYICVCVYRVKQSISRWIKTFFSEVLPCVLLKGKFLWLVLLNLLSVVAMFIVFHYPGLRLPTSREFQLFQSESLLEKYDLIYKNHFWFERQQRMEVDNLLPLRFVWGVLPLDTGDHMDPHSLGSLVFDTQFDLADNRSQIWLLQFCSRLRQQPFYHPLHGPMPANCFIETFKDWMDRRCDDNSGSILLPCCVETKFPYEESVFYFCISKALEALYKTPASFYTPGAAGPRFSRETGRLQAIVVEYVSNYSYSVSYSEMKEFYTSVEGWFQEQLLSAPLSMKHGWFVSQLDFYDLQDSLAQGTFVSMALAMSVALLVLLCTTLNLLISIFAIITITHVIIVTIAALVLLGWTLNVLEAVAVAIAIGLAVDFTLHYGVVYKSSHRDDRVSSTFFSLSLMGSPIAMAAFTTFFAGLGVLPSHLVVYLQIGTFIIILMSTSWLYSTFYFQCLLLVWGPERGCGQVTLPRIHCNSPVSHHSHIDKTVYSSAISESTVSSSSYARPLPKFDEDSDEEVLQGAPRQRSRSAEFPSPDCRREFLFLYSLPLSHRKSSLPSHHFPVATSSNTIIFSEEDSEAIIPNKSADIPNVWVRRV